MEFLIAGAGGFLGTCLRYAFTRLMEAFHLNFPAATLLSNVTAGLCIGIVAGLEARTGLISPKIRLFTATGILGGLSTFSTFNLETIRLFYDKRYLPAAGNVLLNLILSFGAVALGMAAVRAAGPRG